MVQQYEKMLAEGSGTTMSQEGWGTAFNATGTQQDDDGNSLTESIVKYAERATAAESKVSELESRLSNLEMGNQQYAAEAAYFTPQAPTFQYPAPPATIMVPPAQPQWGGGATTPTTTTTTTTTQHRVPTTSTQETEEQREWLRRPWWQPLRHKSQRPPHPTDGKGPPLRKPSAIRPAPTTQRPQQRRIPTNTTRRPRQWPPIFQRHQTALEPILLLFLWL
jgi:hypothetical protein